MEIYVSLYILYICTYLYEIGKKIGIFFAYYFGMNVLRWSLFCEIFKNICFEEYLFLNIYTRIFQEVCFLEFSVL